GGAAPRPGRPQAMGVLPPAQRRKLAQGADPQPPQGLDQVVRLALRQVEAAGQRRNGEGGEEPRHTNVCSYDEATESTYETFPRSLNLRCDDAGEAGDQGGDRSARDLQQG